MIKKFKDNLYEFQTINSPHSGNNWSPNYKVYYFREPNDFMFLSRVNLATTILSNANNLKKKCQEHFFRVYREQYSLNFYI